MPVRIPLLICVLSLVTAAGARAEAPQYFHPSPIDSLKLLPAPPSANSAENRAELDLMLAIQEKRTQADVDRCASEVKLTVEAFQSVLGPWCTSKNLPQTAKLFAALERDAKDLSDTVKKHYQRTRPDHEDDRLHVPIANDPTSAYPGGHATRGILFASILSEAFPDKREALMERGREIGWDRVIASLHHPSDIAAGRVLGQALAQSLLADQKFQADFDEIKKELTAAEHHAAEPAGAR